MAAAFPALLLLCAAPQEAPPAARLHLPPDFQASVWADGEQLANPVAFTVDARGRVYVAESFRQETGGVPDNRSHPEWRSEDLQLRTVEDRGRMYLRHHPEYASEWTQKEERIQLLYDEDGDFRADHSQVWADGFRTLLTGTGAGLVTRGDSLWYTCIPDLWRLRDRDGDGHAEERESLLHGFGVRTSLRGHDLHGPVFGPLGNLWFSVGDRGFHVQSREGGLLADPGRGAVFRCRPDGTGLQIWTHGLRNPQELAFDDYGDLFTVDNNSDAGDRARLVYLMEGSDCGWSMNFQYLPDRGPWMAEGWWKPPFAGQAAFLNAPLANFSDGPAGLAAYPGTGLPAALKGSFFLCDFRGSPADSGVRRFTLAPDGAGFRLDAQEKFCWGVLATDVAFAPDGRILISDWIEGWVGTGSGRILQLRHPANAEAEETATLLRTAFTARKASELARLLGHPDRRVRFAAQRALVARGARGMATLERVARRGPNTLARLHALWGMGQLGATLALEDLHADPDPEIRAQLARIASATSAARLLPHLREALTDPFPRVRYQAALAIGHLGTSADVPALVALLRRDGGQDRFLRHAACHGLALLGDRDALLALREDEDPQVRLGAILALRELAAPEVADFLDDPDPAVASEAARAIYGLGLASAYPALAAHLEDPTLPEPLLRRAIQACNLLGGVENATRLASYVARVEAPLELRREALRLLVDWQRPAPFDRLRNEARHLGNRPPGEARPALLELLPSLLAENDAELQSLAARAAGRYRILEVGPTLAELVADPGSALAVRRASLASLIQSKAREAAAAWRLALDSPSAELRGDALDALAHIDPAAALPLARAALASPDPSQLRLAFPALARIATPEADTLLAKEMKRSMVGPFPGAALLELLQAARARASAGSEPLRAALEAWRASLPPNDPIAPYRFALAGGSPAAGRKVFFGQTDIACQRCHWIEGISPADGQPSEVGPHLEGVASRLSPAQILAEIVTPTARIAPGFETKDPNGKPLPATAMPPGLADRLSPSELRDLLAFLQTLR